MTITQHISIDLQQPGNMPMVHAVQGDEYSRKIEIELYSNGVSWNPPDGCDVAIRYGKPDGKGGIYAVLPDSTIAYSVEGNAITVTLAPQMVTVPGLVQVQVSIIKDRKDRISTFSFSVNVEADPSKGELKSENYVNWKTYYIPQTKNAVVGQYLKISKVDADGRVIEVVPVDAPSGGGLNNAARALLITILRNAVYDSDQSANITALENALASGGAEPDEPVTPEKTLTSISATYSGGEVKVGTAVTDLTGIVVTAHYSDGTSKAVTGYTLSGTIAEGSNTITVSYGGKTATFTVAGIAESGGDEPDSGDIHDGYISDGLEFRLDAIRNTTDGHDNSITANRWDDVSGNGYATTMPHTSGFTVHDTYIENLSRAQVKVKSDDLRTKMLNGFTVETVFQPPASDSTDTVFAVDNGTNNRLMLQSGQFRVYGNSTLHGTAMTNINAIRHCAYVYDGTTIKMYHDGILDTTIDAAIDVSAWAFVEFWGNMDWADVCKGTYNAARIYTRVLSDDEIKANYDNDIARFGTVNVEVA